jgi:hypothetical protein
MQQLKFSSNWNNRKGAPAIGKLNCRAFTTLRLSDRFNIGDRVEVVLGDESMGVAEVMDKKVFYAKNMTPGMSYIDTGLSPEETLAVLERMYPTVDFEKQPITWYLLKYI